MAKSLTNLTLLEAPTPWGCFYAAYSRRGLAALFFPRTPIEDCENRTLPANEARCWHVLTCHALAQVLQGRAAGDLPPFDWSDATPFQRAVWEALLRIPRGQVRTYAEVAKMVGRPGAARAVGSACGANPVPLLVPCHRVVGARGWLGGFSAGLEWKRRLLALEGHPMQHARLVL